MLFRLQFAVVTLYSIFSTWEQVRIMLEIWFYTVKPGLDGKIFCDKFCMTIFTCSCTWENLSVFYLTLMHLLKNWRASFYVTKKNHHMRKFVRVHDSSEKDSEVSSAFQAPLLPTKMAAPTRSCPERAMRDSAAESRSWRMHKRVFTTKFGWAKIHEQTYFHRNFLVRIRLKGAKPVIIILAPLVVTAF